MASSVATSVILASAYGSLPAREHDLPVRPTVASEASFPEYSVRIVDRTELGAVPALQIFRDRKLVFRFPLVSSLDSASAKEHLSAIEYRVELRKAGDQVSKYGIIATAKSSLWRRREFHWSLYADHIEFDQQAWGDGKLGRCYFLQEGQTVQFEVKKGPKGLQAENVRPL